MGVSRSKCSVTSLTLLRGAEEEKQTKRAQASALSGAVKQNASRPLNLRFSKTSALQGNLRDAIYLIMQSSMILGQLFQRPVFEQTARSKTVLHKGPFRCAAALFKERV